MELSPGRTWWDSVSEDMKLFPDRMHRLRTNGKDKLRDKPLGYITSILCCKS